MSLTHETIKETLVAQFGDKILGWEESYGMLSFTIQPDHNLKALTFLNDDPAMGFQFLTDVTAVHYPDR